MRIAASGRFRGQPDRRIFGDRAVASSMRKAGGGAIVNISSGAGFTATFGLAAYVSSKWAVRGLTKTAALELGHDNIRVNSIHPGAICTPLLADQAPDAAAMAATMEGAGVGLSAIPRIAEPEEITRLVLFVASDDASVSNWIGVDRRRWPAARPGAGIQAAS
ncbi:MAG TPA: SDR family oxidoreductase [Vicinamibacterales bacterium]|nr:SDR family oxidoreductase [Vicinamibacterales bacterium]